MLSHTAPTRMNVPRLVIRQKLKAIELRPHKLVVAMNASHYPHLIVVIGHATLVQRSVEDSAVLVIDIYFDDCKRV